MSIGLHFMLQLAMQKISQVKFESDTPVEAYQQHDQHSYCVSILASDFKGKNNWLLQIKPQHKSMTY